MQLDIRGWNVRLTPSLLDHVERRVRIAVRRLAAAPSRVAVRVEDEDGAGKLCRIDMEVLGRSFAVEEIDRDIFVAIERATARAVRAAEPPRAA